MLKQRIISGLILAFTLTALIFSIGDVFLSYFVGIIASVSLWEYLKVRFSNLITLTILVAFVFCMYLSNILFFNILKKRIFERYIQNTNATKIVRVMRFENLTFRYSQRETDAIIPTK